ncbi:MAG: SurA N-terminal domain-containing protein, partial [Pseudomonadota bacterium]|nr:SurA N-terminal domain-containing protein [Pseudomonadota bacterium]
MLESFRSNMKGVALGITILIAVVFIFSGTGTVFLANSSNGAVASVGETEISEFDLLRSISNQKQQILEQNPDLDTSLISDDMLRPAALERLIRREVLVQTAQENGLSMSESSINSEILNVEGFKTDGKFDQDRYKFVLQNQGYTHASFKQMLNNDLVVQQLISGVSETAFVTEFENQSLASVSEQSRTYYYLTIPVSKYSLEVSVSDNEISDFYQNNPNDFMTEEQLKIDYIELKPEMLADKNAISEEMVQTRFEAELADLDLTESRRVSHILITENNDTLIDEINAKIAANASFESLVSEYSEDFGSASVGGDLGFTSGETFPDSFEEAVMELNIGEVSGPVQTESGIHFIKLTEIQKDEYVYEDEKARIMEDLANEAVSEIFVEKLEILRELSFNAESLSEVAEDAGLLVKTTDYFPRSGGKGVASNNVVINAAFSDDVLVQGYASEVLELGDDYFTVIKLNEFKDEELRPLTEVKDSINEKLADEKLEILMREESEKLLVELRDGETIEALAKNNNLDWQVVLSASRRVTDQNPEINAEVFKLNTPNG